MKHKYLPTASSHLHGNRLKKIWKSTVRFLAVVTVFCTTYALILPAVTLEGSSIAEALDDDYAYISSASLVSDPNTVSGYAVNTGTAPFDSLEAETRTVKLLDLSGYDNGTVLSNDGLTNWPEGMTKGKFDDYDGTRSVVELEDGTKALKLAFDQEQDMTQAPSGRQLSTIANYEFRFQIPATYRPYLNSVKLTMENKSNVFTSWEPIINGETKEVVYPYFLLAFTDGTSYSKISDKTLQIDKVDYEYTLPAVGVAKVGWWGYVDYAATNGTKWTEADKSGMTDVVLSITVPYIENLNTYVLIKDITLTLEGPDYIFGAGNDSTENDNILRTFDIATYNAEFKTALRKEATDANIQGYLVQPLHQVPHYTTSLSMVQPLK